MEEVFRPLDYQQLPFSSAEGSSAVDRSVAPVGKVDAFKLPEFKEQTSPWPTIIAILAAANGNVGPLFQLTEQKRRTEISKAMLPILTRTQQLANSGQWEQALSLANQAFGQFGPRSPEIAQYLQQLSGRLASKQQSWVNASTVYKMLNKGIDKDNPDKWFVDALGEAVKAKTPVAEQTLASMITKLGLESRYAEGRLIQSSRLTGRTNVLPVQQVVRAENISDMAGQILVNDPDLASLFGGNPTVPGITTLINDPGTPPPIKQLLQNKLAEAQKYTLNFNIAKNIPLEAGISEGLMRQGLTPEQVAVRDLGKNAAQKWTNAINYLADRQRSVTAAALTARSDVNTSLWPDRRFTVDLTTGQLDTVTEAGNAFKDPNKAVLDDKVYGQFRALFDVKNRLSLMLPYIKNLPEATSLTDRIGSFVTREINQRLNLDPNLTGEQAVQALVKDGIENLANALGVSAKRFDYLTRPISGTLASREGAIEVLDRMADYAQTQYNLIARQNNSQALKSFIDKLPTESPVKPTGLPLPPGAVKTPSGAVMEFIK